MFRQANVPVSRIRMNVNGVSVVAGCSLTENVSSINTPDSASARHGLQPESNSIISVRIARATSACPRRVLRAAATSASAVIRLAIASVCAAKNASVAINSVSNELTTDSYDCADQHYAAQHCQRRVWQWIRRARRRWLINAMHCFSWKRSWRQRRNEQRRFRQWCASDTEGNIRGCKKGISPQRCSVRRGGFRIASLSRHARVCFAVHACG